jgi:hypothetical protein
MICLNIKSRLFAAAFCSELVSFREIIILFVARKGIPSCVLFRGMVRNEIPRICIYFGFTERNSELCSLPQKGSEQNNGSLLLFFSTERNSQLFSLPQKGSERNSVAFCSAEQPEFHLLHYITRNLLPKELIQLQSI